MRIRGNKLKEVAAQRGVSVQQLADAIVEPGFDAPAAVSALNNWMIGRDHPRCKAKTMRRIAEVLGVRVTDIVKFTSKVNNHRVSPRKAKLLIDLIRGRSIEQAQSMLRFTPKRAAVNIMKALDAAIADAQLADADVTTLFVSESRVDQAAMIKRFQPKDRGRAHPILKPLSHITISVEERSSNKAAR